MKLRYDRDEDILVIETGAKGTIDHAEHAGSLISHMSADGNLLLLEVLDASRFLEAAFRAGIRGQEEELPAS